MSEETNQASQNSSTEPSYLRSSPISNLDNLRISQQEQDKLTDLDISDVTMGWAYRQTAFSPQRRLTWLSEQLLTVGVALIFCLPITLLLSRSLSGDNVQAVWRWLPVGGVGAIALTTFWTGYRWQAGQRLIILSHLLDEIDRFNEMVAAVEILEELGSTQNSQLNLENKEDVLEALHLTRESLVCGLMTERVMRKHQRLMARRQQMFSNIERNLATLQQLQVNDAASDYGRLLNEAIQIGTSVHHELSRERT
ncbi:MAG: Syntaxin [Phormidesmis priestleyi Ana]|uniref:Syntaxin n=1 Tax=Phormidesmis priestleyi Ana TaxID=1666911 RepID=A0A0P7ZJT4_9CYAN|nr:MAG: Syntaxin [Phormidesmis priestleyi Ana]